MTAPEIDIRLLGRVLDPHAGRGRDALLPVLLDVQRVFGWIPEIAAEEVAKRLMLPLSEVHGVVEFYAMLHDQPTAREVVRVCTSPSCSLAGAHETLEALCSHLGVKQGEPTPDGKWMVLSSPCLGLCEHAPAALLGNRPVAPLRANLVEGALQGGGDLPRGLLHGERRWLTSRCGVVDPSSLSHYEKHGGWEGLRQAVTLTPGEVIDLVKASGLVGRGGAAFPTGLKWEGTARSEGQPKYVICNGDESEPGTFKDRVLMEEDPFSILEGMIIASYAVGASRGFWYIRGEYPRAVEVCQQAIRLAESAGFLGENILDKGFSFSVELRSGAGAYVCGEETALFESIEGKRGFPRIKPPFPTTHGLFSKPTVINNVETLANVPLILRMGVPAYRALGTEQSPGPKLFCLSGDVQQPGLYETGFGATLEELVFGMAGGIPEGRSLQAVLLGGAAGTFAAPDQLDVPLTFEGLRAAGLSLGSGVILVFDDRRDLRQVLLELTEFFAEESCGKCYPCQLGTQRQYEILRRVAQGKSLPGDAARLEDVGWTMADASLCGLGQTAASAVLSALKHWPELVAA
ncbi:MAG: NAD(P)H-dependent oxidoreductase subunit E [Anaerolineales bacterium]|jgi:NADH-quinone oxidoreductase subunit F